VEKLEKFSMMKREQLMECGVGKGRKIDPRQGNNRVPKIGEREQNLEKTQPKLVGK
jgi:hypothetical protein